MKTTIFDFHCECERCQSNGSDVSRRSIDIDTTAGTQVAQFTLCDACCSLARQCAPLAYWSEWLYEGRAQADL